MKVSGWSMIFGCCVGTPASVSQMAKDVVVFLRWASGEWEQGSRRVHCMGGKWRAGGSGGGGGLGMWWCSYAGPRVSGNKGQGGCTAWEGSGELLVQYFIKLIIFAEPEHDDRKRMGMKVRVAARWWQGS